MQDRRYILRSLFNPGSYRFWQLPTWRARGLYLSLILHAEDNGWVECEMRTVRAYLAGESNYDNAAIAADLTALETSGLIRRHLVSITQPGTPGNPEEKQNSSETEATVVWSSGFKLKKWYAEIVGFCDSQTLTNLVTDQRATATGNRLPAQTPPVFDCPLPSTRDGPLRVPSPSGQPPVLPVTEGSEFAALGEFRKTDDPPSHSLPLCSNSTPESEKEAVLKDENMPKVNTKGKTIAMSGNGSSSSETSSVSDFGRVERGEFEGREREGEIGNLGTGQDVAAAGDTAKPKTNLRPNPQAVLIRVQKMFFSHTGRKLGSLPASRRQQWLQIVDSYGELTTAAARVWLREEGAALAGLRVPMLYFLAHFEEYVQAALLEAEASTRKEQRRAAIGEGQQAALQKVEQRKCKLLEKLEFEQQQEAKERVTFADLFGLEI
jgi:hypothetical protein